MYPRNIWQPICCSKCPSQTLFDIEILGLFLVWFVFGFVAGITSLSYWLLLDGVVVGSCITEVLFG